MKTKSPKPAAKTSGKKRTVVSRRTFVPPAYGIDFVDRQNNSNDGTVQGKFESPEKIFFSQQKKQNKTGLPDSLKDGVENLSGCSMDDVKVHYNSDKPAQLQAHAFARGTDIHLAPGQEKHLPHEAWHIVQQKQGRVAPTMQLRGKVNVNDGAALEKEADMMGARSLRARNVRQYTPDPLSGMQTKTHSATLPRSVQMVKDLGIPMTLRGDSKDVVQLIPINKQTVKDEVWQVFRELRQEAKLLLLGNEDFYEFFDLSPDQQIGFLNAVNHSTTVITSLLQSQSRAIMGPSEKSPSLRDLQLQFLELNPLFLRNLLAVTQGRFGTFHLSGTSSLLVSDFSAFRSPEPSKALIDPREQSNRLVKQFPLPIESVMRQKDLRSFLVAQHIFQMGMNSMDDLKSIGFEFEFASFTGADGIYSEVEIIPSHQLMAKAAVGGNFFGLSWRLESDSKNTLELVSPPFVFSRDELGVAKSRTVKSEAEKTAQTVVSKISADEGTLPQTADAFAEYGIGHGWKVEDPYRDFKVVSNKKSGGSIYAQQNVSMYPHEIGELLEKKFREDPYEASISDFTAADPTNVAKLVRNTFLAGLPVKASDTVKQAIAIFARYASNVLAIPSFRHRQVTGVRKDTMATDVKETLGVWVKTDPLNLLMHLLQDSSDREVFKFALAQTGKSIRELFVRAGEKLVNDAKPPAPPEPTLQEIGVRLNLLVQQGMPRNGDTVKLAKQQLIAARAPQNDPSVAVAGYAATMLEEITAFIERALNVEQHRETQPKLTTRDFLKETFGTGEGVRKGTFIKGIPTSKGPMYVTELR